MRTSRIVPAAWSTWLLAFAVGMGQEPGPLPGNLGQAPRSNQEIADHIAGVIRQYPAFKQYRVRVSVAEGRAELSGYVGDASQRAQVIYLARQVPGVVDVIDRIEDGSAVVQTQVPLPVFQGGAGGNQAPLAPLPPWAAPAPGALAPMTPPSPLNGMPSEPYPIYQGNPAMPNPQTQPPPMPPYAWPATAPYNNWSRIAYPEVYKYDQFPFIGPFYPYPKVPLGWRSVNLTWEDGNWWFSRQPTGHDWWRIRYY